MGTLTNLYRLSKFVVAEGNSSLKPHFQVDGLKALKRLRGSIEINIHFPKSGAIMAMNDILSDGGYMREKEHLNRIRFKCNRKRGCAGRTYNDEEEYLKALQPHPNLKELQFVGYHGARMPKWGNEYNLATVLPNLVHLVLNRCSQVQCLPWLSTLQHLKTLNIEEMPKLEYIESQPATTAAPPIVSSRDVLAFLPRLENLCLRSLPNLKQWCQQQQSSVLFPQLRLLQIRDCGKLTSLPDCPYLEELELFTFNKQLQIATNPSSSPRLKALSIDDMEWLRALHTESYRSLIYLKLFNNKEIQNLTEIGHVLEACSSSLRTLEIYYCPNLTSLSGGLRSLAALANLSLLSLPIQNLAEDGKPWGSLCNSLHYLAISKCKELQSFPKWMPELNCLQ